MRRLIVALDTSDLDQARRWARAVSPYAGLLKVGLEFFLAQGAAGYRALADLPIFLDLKLHDIPNTVRGAVRSLLPLNPTILTIHASGGRPMIEAAAGAAAAAGQERPLILAVTVLTSLEDTDLAAIGMDRSPDEQVLRLARLAVDAGADGVVCSPREVALLRRELGPVPKLVVPGIRPEGSNRGDQARTLTPEEAIDAGADWIVVGRPITSSPNPGQAAAAIAASIS